MRRRLGKVQKKRPILWPVLLEEVQGVLGESVSGVEIRIRDRDLSGRGRRLDFDYRRTVDYGLLSDLSILTMSSITKFS